MAVKSIKVLRKTTGSVGVETAEITVHYRVETSSTQDGPATVLAKFPIGRVLDQYTSATEVPALNQNAPFRYQFPSPDEGCNGTIYQGPESGIGSNATANLYISNVRIVSRELGDTSLTKWIVAVTYTRSTEHGPRFSCREIVPYYTYEERPQEFAAFLGGYSRYVGTRTPNQGPNQPGEWIRIPDELFKDSALYGPLDAQGKSTYISKPNDPYAPQLKPIAIANTAGEPIEAGQLRQREARPAFKCTWFSYTALDFTEAVGKVNSKKYKLIAWDSHFRWPVNSFAGDGVDNPAVIFYRCFNPRELLVHAVDCELIRWSGRNCYKYTVDLVFDRDGHDKYIMNKGFGIKQGPGDNTQSGGKNPSEETKDEELPIAQIKGKLGENAKTETLLDTNGKPLLNYAGDGEMTRGGADAIWLKYRTHEEIDFYDPWTIRSGPLKGEFDAQNAAWDQTGGPGGEFSKCPLFWDGGFRYAGAKELDDFIDPQTKPYWPDGDCREPDPGNESQYENP